MIAYRDLSLRIARSPWSEAVEEADAMTLYFLHLSYLVITSLRRCAIPQNILEKYGFMRIPVISVYFHVQDHVASHFSSMDHGGFPSSSNSAHWKKEQLNESTSESQALVT